MQSRKIAPIIMSFSLPQNVYCILLEGGRGYVCIYIHTHYIYIYTSESLGLVTPTTVYQPLNHFS
uniref:Uncharacterized protein n=1 Tax=Manihot esculenta TaxID=3983 RepID=A0A2C9VYL9_MANES